MNFGSDFNLNVTLLQLKRVDRNLSSIVVTRPEQKEVDLSIDIEYIEYTHRGIHEYRGCKRGWEAISH